MMNKEFETWTCGIFVIKPSRGYEYFPNWDLSTYPKNLRLNRVRSTGDRPLSQ
jgi:hypothetical protein